MRLGSRKCEKALTGSRRRSVLWAAGRWRPPALPGAPAPHPRQGHLLTWQCLRGGQRYSTSGGPVRQERPRDSTLDVLNASYKAQEQHCRRPRCAMQTSPYCTPLGCKTAEHHTGITVGPVRCDGDAD